MAAKASHEYDNFRKLIKDFHGGRASRAEVARAIHAHSTSIGLKWLVESLRKLYPDSRVTHHETEVQIELLCATQPRLQKPKYQLVRLLFDDAGTFDRYNDEFFSESPVCVVRIGGGRYAIIDGHHRVRRYAELTDKPAVRATLISTDSDDLIERFREEVEEVRQAAGTADVRKLPVV